MTRNFYLTLSFLYLATFVFAQTSLQGKITDAETHEDLIGANIVIQQNGAYKAGITTDFDGNYKVSLDPGVYEVEVSYIGYPPNLVINVEVKAGHQNVLDVQLGGGDEGIHLDEVVVVEYKVPLIEKDNTTSGSVITMGRNKNSSGRGRSPRKRSTRKKSATPKVKHIPTKDIHKLAAKTAGLSSADSGDDVNVRGSRNSGTDYYIDGIRVSGNLIAGSEIDGRKTKRGKKEKTKSKVSHKIEENIPAGQLTAGEWNDLENWNFWSNSLVDESYVFLKDVWKMYPTTRYSVFVQNEDGFPIPNAKVLLKDDREIIWSSVSDNKGTAELWENMFEKNGSTKDLKIIVEYNGESISENSIAPYGNGINTFTIKAPCKSPANVDVMFAIDATSSMSDEIRYLKSELKDVMQRVKVDHEKMNFRFGAVFYRDKGDDYITKTQPFSESLDEIITFFNQQEAGGGGDGPEAVEDALEKAIESQKWSENAVARILFLVLDAPPHSRPENLKKIHRQIKKAAEKGIKIVPVSASGIDRSAEFLLKTMALSTNGTYTFLTNHSGIGGHHIDPVADTYNVETLNDLLVRVVSENVEYQECDDPIQPIVSSPAINSTDIDLTKSDKKMMQDVHFFPNPATSFIYVALKNKVDELTIYDTNGKRVFSKKRLPVGETKVELKGLPAGNYFIRFRDGKTVVTNKLVIIRT